MGFGKGGTATHSLGNMHMSNRRKNDLVLIKSVSQTYCSPCSDKTQSELHDADAIVLNCMDFRLRDNVACHLTSLGYKNNYDEAIAAGASLGYAGLLDFDNWDTFIDQHVSLARSLHDISKIIIIEHERCGAYKAQYGVLTPDKELDLHKKNTKIATDILWKKFNPIDGTITKIPNLQIISYIISIDACSFTELNRRQ